MLDILVMIGTMLVIIGTRYAAYRILAMLIIGEMTNFSEFF